MHEYFVAESHESVGFAWAQGKCNLTRQGHKHAPHVDGTRACPGHTAQALYAFERPEMDRVIPEPFPSSVYPEDADDMIRSLIE